MAIIMERPGVPFDSIHREVYSAAADYLPPQDFRAISARQPELAANPQAFQEILKYFTIKPGYTILAELCYRAGIHPVLATCLPSLIGYLAVGLLLFSWSQSVSNPGSSAILTILVAISPPMTDLARYSSPDMMCAAISVGAIALILNSRVTAGLSLLYLAIWVRPDAILLLIPVAIALVFNGLARWSVVATLVIGGVMSAWLILGGNSLIWEYVVVDPSISRWESYLAGLLSPSLYLLLFLGMGVGLLYFGRSALPSRSFLIWAGLASLVMRYALHPVFEDRFNLPVYFLFLMITWEAVMNWRKRVALTKQ